MMNQACSPRGFVMVVVTPTAAVGFTNGIVSGTTTFVIPTDANMAVIAAQTTTLVWRDDGTAPTPTAGMPIQVSTPPLEYSGNLKAIQFVSVAGTAALSAALYKTAG